MPQQVRLLWHGCSHSIATVRIDVLMPLTSSNVRKVIPIPGSRTVARVEENAAAAELQLSMEDTQEIRALCENADVRGTRLPPQYIPDVHCISLEEWKGE